MGGEHASQQPVLRELRISTVYSVEIAGESPAQILEAARSLPR
jgi:hypothetical protein